MGIPPSYLVCKTCRWTEKPNNDSYAEWKERLVDLAGQPTDFVLIAQQNLHNREVYTVLLLLANESYIRLDFGKEHREGALMFGSPHLHDNNGCHERADLKALPLVDAIRWFGNAYQIRFDGGVAGPNLQLPVHGDL